MTAETFALEDVRVRQTAAPGAVPVDGVSIEVTSGEAVGLVGESGCGKSVTAYASLGLLPPSLAASGTLRLGSRHCDLAASDDLRPLRGHDVAMVFQDPGSSLNPVMPVGRQLEDVLRSHAPGGRNARRRAAVELLDRVGIAAPDRAAKAYPFELSGGMRQRVLIAMALSCRPRLLIADEPTTALDTTVQAQIMELLRELVRDEGMAMLFISHDLALVSETCQRVYVMYAGRVVESGAVRDVLERPSHPYTSALVGCLVTLGQGAPRLLTVGGSVPAIDQLPPGCRFAPRCEHAVAACSQTVPELRPVGASRAACLRADELRLPSTTSLAAGCST